GLVALALAGREGAETDEAFHDLSLVAELTEEFKAFLVSGPGLHVVALLLCELGQVADGDREEPGAAGSRLTPYSRSRCSVQPPPLPRPDSCMGSLLSGSY